MPFRVSIALLLEMTTQQMKIIWMMFVMNNPRNQNMFDSDSAKTDITSSNKNKKHNLLRDLTYIYRTALMFVLYW